MKLAIPPLLLMAASLAGCNASVAEPAPADEPADAVSTQWVVPDPADKLELTDAQWRDRLTEPQFYILREDGTEYAGSSPLDKIKHEQTPGDFACAGCANHLFETEHKFDSRTGWPSFDRPVSAQHVREIPENDRWNRIEVVCVRCDGHLGHVFNDGPRNTTGLRYCINGDALTFHPRPNAAHLTESADASESGDLAVE